MIPLLLEKRNTFRGALFSAILVFQIEPTFSQPAVQDETWVITSPDENIRTTVSLRESPSDATFTWSVTRNEFPILDSCQLGLRTPEGDLLHQAKLTQSTNHEVRERVPILFGKAAYGDNGFNETRFQFATTQDRLVEIQFRCYNDAVAFRYVVSAPHEQSLTVIVDEQSSFRPAGNPLALVQYLEHHQTSHEHEVATIPYSEIKPESLLDLPLTLVWPNRTSAAITEASLREYAGMGLRKSPQSDRRLISALSPKDDGSKVSVRGTLKTPWRVVLISPRPGGLLESNTIYCLNDPPELADTSWIQPGKLTFHWWNGDVFDGKPGHPSLSFAMAKQYIDFCADHGLPIHSITSTEGVTTPWYHQTKPGVAPGDDTDVTRLREGFNLVRIKDYADQRGVRLWTWVHQAALRGRVEEAFAAFEKMGWKGMMIDFFDHDDQDHVAFAEDILRAAGRHHILIHFHGVWKPTGLERTFPHLMNHEGALNLEYLKWSDRCTPKHNLNMAFTRLIAGPMDYHLGGFRALSPKQFQARQVAPNVLGTRAHMLAMYVCFDNPAPMLADYPKAYENQPGFDFLMDVPTWWDETRILRDSIGECLVTARRKGKIWYLGGMTGDKPSRFPLALNFLDEGSYQTRLWTDSASAQSNPNQLTMSQQLVSSASQLPISMVPGGGFVAKLTPLKDGSQ